MIETNEDNKGVVYDHDDETWYNHKGEVCELHKSTRGDGTEYCFFTNGEHWDCECEEDYIHEKAEEKYCPKCDTFNFDQPDSRENEIDHE